MSNDDESVSPAATRLTLDERRARYVEMRRLYFGDGMTMAMIAVRFGISRARVSAIINNEPQPYGRPLNPENRPENDDDPGPT